jgi:hypothetical protein
MQIEEGASLGESPFLQMNFSDTPTPLPPSPREFCPTAGLAQMGSVHHPDSMRRGGGGLALSTSNCRSALLVSWLLWTQEVKRPM